MWLISYMCSESGILLRTIRAYWSKRRVVPPVLFRTNYYSIEILHGVTAISLTYYPHHAKLQVLPVCVLFQERISTYMIERYKLNTDQAAALRRVAKMFQQVTEENSNPESITLIHGKKLIRFVIYSSKKETQNYIQKKKLKTTFKKRNAKPHIGDIGKIILIAVWQVTGQRSWSPTVNSVCVLHVS